MSDALPVVYLARHGETAWTISRRHTSFTDLPLTAQGEVEPVRLGERLEGLAFAAVITSPFLRVFAARWLGFEPGAGKYFVLGTASLSAVGYEHDRSEPVIRFWDETPHERRSGPTPVRGYRQEARR
jgi:broad specificity phosphatase PhoE